VVSIRFVYMEGIMWRFGILFLIGTAFALAGENIIQMYKCGQCQKVEQYTEGGYRTHYCSGSSDKPHSKQLMQHIGEQRVKS